MKIIFIANLVEYFEATNESGTGEQLNKTALRRRTLDHNTLSIVFILFYTAALFE